MISIINQNFFIAPQSIAASTSSTRYPCLPTHYESRPVIFLLNEFRVQPTQFILMFGLFFTMQPLVNTPIRGI